MRAARLVRVSHWIVVWASASTSVVACRPATEVRDEETPTPVHCAAVTRQRIDPTETLRGRVAAPPGGDLPLASQVAGRVLEVHVHEGDRVAPGALIALVDDSASRDGLRQADAAMLQAKAAQSNAEATLERTRELVRRGIAARQELDDGTAKADQARAGVSAAAAASDLARRTLGRVQVRSAFEGVVTRVWRGPGALVDGTAATPVAQLAATGLAEFDADATERALVGIVSDQSALVVLSSGGKPIEGRVRTRPAALDPVSGLGLVRIALDVKAQPILGAFGTATVILAPREGVLVIPAAAVRGAVIDGAEVVLCRDGKAELRVVHPGWRDDDRIEVSSGLDEGDRIAVDHVLGLHDGSQIVEEK